MLFFVRESQRPNLPTEDRQIDSLLPNNILFSDASTRVQSTIKKLGNFLSTYKTCFRTEDFLIQFFFPCLNVIHVLNKLFRCSK